MESSSSKSEMLLLRGNLRCPICLEAYKRPRSLSCLHCFCEGCLESVIRRNTDKFVEKKEIECPVCHAGTTAPAGAKTVGGWAKCLPIDSIVSPLPHDTLTESESARLCGHCAAAEEIVDAESYCLECNDFLCQRCTRIHSKVPSSKDHKVSNLSVTQPMHASAEINVGIEICKIHVDKPIEFYCQDHSLLCCGTCAFLHRKCEHVIDVHGIGQGLTDTETQLKSNMETLKKKFDGYTNILDINIANLADSTTSIKQKIKEMRDIVVEKIDQLVTDVSRKADQLRDEYQTSLTERLSGQKSIQAALNTSHFMLETVLENGSETQIFIAVYKIEEQFRQYSCLLHGEQDSATTVQIQLKTSNVLADFVNATEQLADIESIQSKISEGWLDAPDHQTLVEEDNTSSDVVEEDSNLDTRVKTKNGSNNMPPIVDCRVEKVKLVNVLKRRGNRQVPRVVDIAYLHDGRLVYVDNYNSLCCLMDDTYSVVADVKLPYDPLSVVVTGDSELVVATYGKQLHILSVNNNTLTLTRTLSCNSQPRRLAKVSESELMVGWDEEGVGVISLSDGTERSYLDEDSLSAEIRIEREDYIAVDNKRSRVYRTRDVKNTMKCMGLDGRQYFTYRNLQLKEPCGVTTDRDGNIYVCSWGTNNVHQISPDGVLIRTIDVGVTGPYTICFKDNGNHMVVVNNIAKTIPKLSVIRFVPAVQ